MKEKRLSKGEFFEPCIFGFRVAPMSDLTLPVERKNPSSCEAEEGLCVTNHCSPPSLRDRSALIVNEHQMSFVDLADVFVIFNHVAPRGVTLQSSKRYLLLWGKARGAACHKRLLPICSDNQLKQNIRHSVKL